LLATVLLCAALIAIAGAAVGRRPQRPFGSR
jgi:hypothetical protein